MLVLLNLVFLFEEAPRLRSFLKIVLVNLGLSLNNILDKLPGTDVIPKIANGRAALVNFFLDGCQLLPRIIELFSELRYLRVQLINLGVAVLQCSGSFRFDVPRKLSARAALSKAYDRTSQ